MDSIDRKIADLIQSDSQRSNAQIAGLVGVSVSTANERLRKLAASGAVTAWRGVLEPGRFGAQLCAFVFVDVQYQGEESLRKTLCRCPEVQEVHHVTGTHAYLLKLRVADTAALQSFLHHKLKRHPGVTGTETLIVLDTAKETTEIAIGTETGD